MLKLILCNGLIFVIVHIVLSLSLYKFYGERLYRKGKIGRVIFFIFSLFFAIICTVLTEIRYSVVFALVLAIEQCATLEDEETMEIYDFLHYLSLLSIVIPSIFTGMFTFYKLIHIVLLIALIIIFEKLFKFGHSDSLAMIVYGTFIMFVFDNYLWVLISYFIGFSLQLFRRMIFRKSIHQIRNGKKVFPLLLSLQIGFEISVISAFIFSKNNIFMI